MPAPPDAASLCRGLPGVGGCESLPLGEGREGLAG